MEGHGGEGKGPVRIGQQAVRKEGSYQLTELELDIATVVLRIEQASADPNMAEFLLHRMATCDAPRLRKHISPEGLRVMAATAQGNPIGCNNPEPASRDGRGGCRCLVCGRCGNHGNNNQGHYWAYCKVRKATRPFHFCCPGDCELEVEDEQSA